MRVTFVIPNDNLSGGIKVVSIYARALQQRGHEVLVVGNQRPARRMSRLDRLWLRFGSVIDAPAVGSHFEGGSVQLRLFPPARKLTKDDLPDADIVIATFWTTAEFVATLPAAKGRKCYLIQGHETHSGQALDRIHATFRSAMQKIVVSEWLRGVMAQEYGDTSSVLVPNGVDCAQFHAPQRVRNVVPTVGYLHHAAAFKGADIAIEAIAQARRRFPELRSIAFGRGLLTEGPSDPGLSEYFYRPAQSSIRDIYAACDVWLFPSRREGFGLPLLESAACGTPLVAAPAGAAPEILAEGVGILVEPDDPAAMAEGILRMLDMSGAEWQALSARCVEIARQRTWAASEVRFESVLKGLLQ